MSDAVGPGDLVLCVNAAPNHATGRPVPLHSRGDLPCSRRHGICLPLRAFRCPAGCGHRFRVVPDTLPSPAQAQSREQSPAGFLRPRRRRRFDEVPEGDIAPVTGFHCGEQNAAFCSRPVASRLLVLAHLLTGGWSRRFRCAARALLLCLRFDDHRALRVRIETQLRELHRSAISLSISARSKSATEFSST